LAVNAQYNRAKPDSIPVKIAGYQRRRMFSMFLEATRIEEQNTVLDLGVTSDISYSHSNYFENWYPHKDKITACGVDDASFLEQMYPGLRFVPADGRDLPFADREFDYVHSSAVLEHVGSREKQVLFLKQAWRVARKGIFITTPNRWFPVEFHTMLPLAHWLPPTAFRRLCSKIGMGFFASEDNLNLMSAGELAQIASQAGLEEIRVSNAKLGGWPSNLLLTARRPI
jgi:ubiquinone/menaquinone biosynthesis C-methylase UbiE